MKSVPQMLLLCVVCLYLTGCPPSQGNYESQAARKKRAAETYMKLGVGYMKKGKLDISLTKLEKALSLDPKSTNTHNVLGVLYDRLGEVALASNHFQQAISFDPKNASAHNNYGGFLCRQGDLQGAQKQYLAATNNPLYKTPELAYTNAGNCALEAENNATEAKNLFTKALQKNPHYTPALYQMAYLSFHDERFSECRNYIQRFEDIGALHSASSLWLAYRNACKLQDRNGKASYSLLLQRKFPNSMETRLWQDLDKRYGNGCP